VDYSIWDALQQLIYNQKFKNHWPFETRPEQLLGQSQQLFRSGTWSAKNYSTVLLTSGLNDCCWSFICRLNIISI